ncbi:MAG TPA: acyltransferase [Anaerolineae bacterium]|nr:acyltransferase [Anaerolineae bacterium]
MKAWFRQIVYRLTNLHRLDRVKRLRGWYYSGLLARAGTNLRVAEHVMINSPTHVSVGDNCYIGTGAQLYPWSAPITIGSNVLIAAGARLITRKHGFATMSHPMALQGYTNAPIVIEDDVWVGFGAVILPGVTVGRGSIVGSNAVVTRDVEPYSIVGGVPARLIRRRTQVQVV